MNRRSLLRVGMAAAIGSTLGHAAGAAEPPQDITFASDFDELWTTLGRRYCFFTEKRTDWNRVRALYRPMALAAASDEAFAGVVRQVLSELYDLHTYLPDPPVGALRGPISDILAEWRDGQARILAVHADSGASEGGLAAGDIILAAHGRPIEPLLRELAPRCLTRPDPAADTYALNVAIGGRRGQERRYLVASSGRGPREVVLPLRPAKPGEAARPDLEWRRLEDGAGYILIRSFAQDATLESFDKALEALRDAPGLILDIRGNGGGDAAVAEPIMGRFITSPKPYALMRRREGRGLSAPWTEMIEPRGPFTYVRPVAVLTNRWSASMAEGFPMGMKEIADAIIVGTPTMGLGAAVVPIRLDRTGLEAQYSAEPIYDVRGRPQTLMRPDVEVPEGEDILAAGRRALAAATAR